MLIRKPSDISSSEITSEETYLNRRTFIGAAGKLGAGLAVAAGAGGLVACAPDAEGRTDSAGGEVEAAVQEGADKLNSYEEITTYNNYYEFGLDKGDPAKNSGKFKPKPWTVKVDGLVKKPGDYNYDDLIKPAAVGDYVYRLRCVEAWSMVIPWNGVKLADILKRFEPLPSAKYVAFTTVQRPSEMPGLRTGALDWPYIEGLRLDEAMHPLTILATGLYGKTLPNQNGAPLRLIVPWKYGFKGIKSIVRISFTDKQPKTSWNEAAANEYGFFANVNPTVDHPRWTQSSERRIGEFRRIRTQMFNGYAEQVQGLYAGMDLRKNY